MAQAPSASEEDRYMSSRARVCACVCVVTEGQLSGMCEISIRSRGLCARLARAEPLALWPVRTAASNMYMYHVQL